MKKLFLSIAIISALTVGVGAIVASAETNEGNLGYGKSTINEIEDNVENDYWGNPNCEYYNEKYDGVNGRYGKGNNSRMGRGRCGGSGDGMMRNRGSL
ncbi:MAG: hypothetical protein E6248_05745 [Clostridium sp.]|uniref:hypothetical protein n=1 Tax=Clostridium sp. TaxID=1506 RepID=UPI00291518A9|nr:hypothetical protein [Clostridium sp.]MDU5109928.1 hypothetical protein [Clostridium sp.]